MIKKFLLMLTAMVAVSCSSGNEVIDDGTIPPVLPGTGPVAKDPKPKAMWISGSANYAILTVKPSVDRWLTKCKEIGMTTLYMDAMMGDGSSLCMINGMKPAEGMPYDIFDYVLTLCDSLEMDVIASMAPLCVGDTKTRRGPAYESEKWNGKTQCRKVPNADNPEQYTIVDIMDDTSADAVMLDPCFQDVRDYCAEICLEVVTKYKHHKSFRGLSLDYVRYHNADAAGNWYGYGENFTKRFEAEMGKTVTNAHDFISAGGGFGNYFKEWIYFRTKSVSETIRTVSKKIKANVPECEVHLWASAQWSSRYSVGQNWASKDYVPSGSQYMEGYEQTGFAEDLDVFILGAYANDIYIKDNPSSDWTVENFVTTYQKYIPKNHKCQVWGSLPAYAYDVYKMRDATLLCLNHTDGLMVFELGHVRNRNLWNGIEAGIELSGY